MNFNVQKPRFFVIPFLWVAFGLVYGLQHYFTYLIDGYSCNFTGTIFGQMHNFLIWGFVAVYSFQFENGNLKMDSGKIDHVLKFLVTMVIVFFLHLIILFTTNWGINGGSFQSAVINYQDRYVFGWFYFQLLVYCAIVSYYAPSVRKRFIIGVNKIANYRSKTYLEYFDLYENKVEKRIYLENVETINANDYYIELRSDQRKYLVRESLKDVERKIDPNGFSRIHRSTIVNLKKVSTIFFNKNQWYVKTISGCTYPVSRSRKETVLRAFVAYKKNRFSA